jgi:hypothetical protein
MRKFPRKAQGRKSQVFKRMGTFWNNDLNAVSPIIRCLRGGLDLSQYRYQEKHSQSQVSGTCSLFDEFITPPSNGYLLGACVSS